MLQLKVDTAKKTDKATSLPRTDGFSYHFTIEAGGEVFYSASKFGNEVAMKRKQDAIRADLESGQVIAHHHHNPLD